METFIGVDPSINNTGFATISCQDILHTELIKNPRTRSFNEKLEYISIEFERLLMELMTAETYIGIELPTERGKENVKRSHDSLLKLTSAFGAIAGIAYTRFAVKRVYLLKPTEWKGQLSKEKTKMRLTTRYGTLPAMSLDEIDALGIAAYVSKHHA